MPLSMFFRSSVGSSKEEVFCRDTSSYLIEKKKSKEAIKPLTPLIENREEPRFLKPHINLWP